MKSSWRRLLFALLLPLSLLTTRASGDAATTPPTDAALRHAVIGTWLFEQDAGVASVAMYTIYREDGIAIQLVKTKFIFKKAKGVWIENRWSIRNGELHLTPLRFRAHSDDAQVDLEEAIRQRLRVDGHDMLYEIKGKERKESRSSLPEDVQQMIGELSRK